MPRSHRLRGVKVCAHCGAGYDGYKAMETRGHYCSPSCLSAARETHRRGAPAVGGYGEPPGAIAS